MNHAELFVAFALVSALSGLAEASEKKGIGISTQAENAAAKVEQLNVSWYYTWSPRELEGLPDEMFVPMVGGDFSQQFAKLDELTLTAKVPALLGFNEPDLPRVDMTVAEAIDKWDELEAAAVRIGSPAPGRAFNGWLEDFMTETKAKDLRVDFVAVHWYGPPKPAAFLKFVDRVHSDFGKPVWITEFAVKDRNFRNDEDGLNDYSEDEVLDFMKAVLPELEKRSFVERYAWFGASRLEKEPISTSQFFDDAGGLTEVGRYYAEFQ